MAKFTRWRIEIMLVDDLMVFKITFSHSSQDKGTSSSLKSMITTSNHKLMIEVNMEEYIRLEEEKVHRRVKVYNWETAKYGKIWCNEDVHDLRSVETEFSAIVFNDALTSEVAPSCEPTNEFPTIVYNDVLTSKLDFLTEPVVNGFNLKDETSLSEYDEKEQNIIYFNDLFLFSVIYPDDLKPDKDN
ncbi:hypothetical protein Tco_0747348 [Tanacetum coccineum]|uniref:Reverse transcriptase domain-containing protein n=1 Tax=Tanacetum coccineum TaxID=301880 RepID=A0ABQ4YTC6_9ASTR